MIESAQPVDPERPVVPRRDGDAPVTTSPGPGRAFPHQQITQIAPVELQDELVARASTLEWVEVRDSCVSVPGARAFHLDPAVADGHAEAFQCDTEFAHIHPPGDGSLHVALPELVKGAVIDAGWGEPHPISGTALIYGPRDRHELDVVWQLVIASYRHALGPDAPSTRAAPASSEVRQLRLVACVDDLDTAARFFCDTLGLSVEFENHGPGPARVVAYQAGRATLELINDPQRRYIDDVENATEPAPRFRVALEVTDVDHATTAAIDAGANLLAPPTLTPWGSLNSRVTAPGDLQLTMFQETEREPT